LDGDTINEFQKIYRAGWLGAYNPYDYFKTIFTKLPNATTVNEVEALLPWNVKGVVR
jgi:hypothetical protein